ncbi:glycosyltransferase [Williamsia herbipolensis]|uniref:Glycosyltransferase n=1 Tax=Williamsia herbipolensis TaxID=1603258 RepID=A0AAU4K791_9NOCA|nr:glycosyltransferase [Williamsia herbipolensis]
MHDLKVCYDAERGVERWAEAGATDGRAPDLWPYGLHRFAELGVDVVHTDNPPLTTSEALRQLVSPSYRRDGAGGPPAQVSIAWDEGAAKRLLVRDRSERNHCGVIWVNDMTKRTDPPLVWDARRVLLQMDSVWCLSRAQVGPLEELLPGIRVDPLLFGIDPDFFAARDYPDSQAVCSFGGDRHRDPDTLFAALERVRQSHPHATFDVQSTSTSPPEWLTLLPRMSPSGVLDVYARSAVVVVTTRSNLHVSGMTVALEAMATGRPVVITDSPGMDDYVQDGVTGAVVPSGDDAAVAAAVSRYLDDPALAAEHGRNGRRLVESTFTTARMCADLATILGLR